VTLPGTSTGDGPSPNMVPPGQAAEGILAVGIKKRFGTVQALSGVDLSVPPGTVLALLGPNGAGKSTLIRILAASLLPDTGSVSIGGVDAAVHPRLARGRLGLVLAEERSFFWRLNGLQNLAFFAALQGYRRSEAVERSFAALERAGISSLAKRRVDRYSTGMKAKLSIARALLGDPAVLLLDEPTRSLDPIATVDTRALVLELAHTQQMAVLFATHDLHEAAAVADYVAVLVGGRIAATFGGGGAAADLEAVLLDATGHNAVPPMQVRPHELTDDDTARLTCNEVASEADANGRRSGKQANGLNGRQGLP